MKTIFFALLFVICQYCIAQIRIKDTIYGKIRSYKETVVLLNPSKGIMSTNDSPIDPEYLPLLGEREKRLSSISLYWYNYSLSGLVNYYREYDDNSRKIKETWVDAVDDSDVVFLYKYDTLNRPVEIKEFRYGEAGGTEKRNYNYKGQLTTVFTDYGDFYLYQLHEYNAKNERIKTRSFDEKGIGVEVHNVYENGKIKQTKRFSDDETGVFVSIQKNACNGLYEKLVEECSYDQRGNLVKKCSYSNIKVIDSTNLPCTTFTYDDNNRLIKEEAGSKFVTLYKYYKDGNLKQRKFIRDGKEKSSTEYSYDKGRLTKAVHKEGNKTIETIEIEYTFDNRNNWIKQVKTVNGVPKYMRSRMIMYR